MLLLPLAAVVTLLLCKPSKAFNPIDMSQWARSLNNKGQMKLQETISVIDGASDVFVHSLGQPDTALGLYQRKVTEFVDYKTLLSLVVKEEQKASGPYRLKLFQKTNGPVPRSYLPTILVLEGDGSATSDSTIFTSLVEEGLRWFLDEGGRPSQLTVALSPLVSFSLESMVKYNRIAVVSLTHSLTHSLTLFLFFSPALSLSLPLSLKHTYIIYIPFSVSLSGLRVYCFLSRRWTHRSCHPGGGSTSVSPLQMQCHQPE